MLRTIQAMAEHMERLLPPSVPTNYEIAPLFDDIADHDDIRKGVAAFIVFIHQLCNCLATDGEKFNKPQKDTHEYTDMVNIKKIFPLIANVRDTLIFIGNDGYVSDSYNCSNAQFLSKLKGNSLRNALMFLSNCGLRFNNTDITTKSITLYDINLSEISYHNEMLIGLKTFARAQTEVHIPGQENILLRCDYKALANKPIDLSVALMEILAPLPIAVSDEVLHLHNYFMQQKFKCSYSTTNFYVRFIYTHHNREIWRFNISLANGYDMGIKATNTKKYADIIKTFPQFVQDKINQGYGCGKKLGTNAACDGKCRGFRLTLDESFIGLSDVIKVWIGEEIK